MRYFGFLTATAMLSLSACVSDTTSQPLAMVVEPGDETMSCDQLEVAIDSTRSKVQSLDQAIMSSERAQSMVASQQRFEPVPGADGGFGMLLNMGGMLTQAWADTQSDVSSANTSRDRQSLASAQQRYEHLVAISEGKCV